MNNTQYVSAKDSAYCPECESHPQQMRARNHGERLCSSGHSFTLKQSRDAQIVDAILDRLFTNGSGEKANRLLLIQESRSGAAKVTDATDLGGYSRTAVRDILRDALR